MRSLFKNIKSELENSRNETRAEGMSAYMRNQFVYYGISSPIRKEICKSYFLPKLVTDHHAIQQFVAKCWDQEEREWKYVAMDFAVKYVKKDMKELIPFFELLVQDQSWWDTVDCIAPNLLGRLLKEDDALRVKKQKKWIESDNFWTQRSSIILQLKYRQETDFETLKELIRRRSGSKEFFIQKAIGWSLREYSKINPKAVRDFVNNESLAPLSRREALRLI